MKQEQDLDFIVPKKIIIGDKVIYPYEELKKLLKQARKAVLNSINEDNPKVDNEHVEKKLFNQTIS